MPTSKTPPRLIGRPEGLIVSGIDDADIFFVEKVDERQRHIQILDPDFPNGLEIGDIRIE